MHAAKLLAFLAASSLAGAVPPAGARQSPPLSSSRQLWATINQCRPKGKPDVVGVRASMPGDRQSKDAMYMRFRLQYLDESSGKWLDLGGSADSGFLPAGSAAAMRQDGRTFSLSPTSHAFRLRGVVSFQWRRGSRVLHAAERVTSAGHRSNAGAEPAGYSAASCLFQ